MNPAFVSILREQLRTGLGLSNKILSVPKEVLRASSTLSSKNVKKKICIVGAGPAGFYTAQYIIKHLPDTYIDILEKLPVPFGLVR